jgi:hypothetical protein
MKETVKRETYNDATFTIERTDEHPNTEGPGYYEHEFVLSIEGETVTNARTLEMQGYEAPCAKAMTRYAKAYIDGARETGGSL